MKTNHPTQDYTGWNLPEGASARLGKGSITGNIAYTPDGTRLVVPSSIGIWIYDAHTLEEVSLITEHRGFDPSAAGFRPDGSLLAVGTLLPSWAGNPGYTILWDEHTREQQLIDGEFRKFSSLVLSPNSKIIAGADEEKRVYLWNVQIEHLKFKKYEEIFSPIAFNSDSGILASARKDGMVQLWNTTTGKPLRILTKQPAEFFPLEELPDGRPTGRQAQGLSLLIFSPDSRTIAGASTLIHFPQVMMSGIIWLWDANTGHIKSTFHVPDIPVLSELGIIGAITPEPGTIIGEIVTSLAFSPNSRIFAVGAYGVISNQAGYATATIQLYNIHTGERKFYSTGHTAPIFSMVFSPDGRTLTSAGRDGTILLWDADIDQNKSIPVKMFDSTPILSPNISSRKSEADHGSDRTQLTNHQLQIKQICEERKIIELCHFTRLENLQNILQKGLLSRKCLETSKEQFLSNDNNRVDRCLDANCLSISFPNYQMFYKIRKVKEEDEGIDNSQWIVLVFDSKVLWEIDCAFCQRSAAHKNISRIPREDRRKPEALNGMFGDFYNIKHQDLSVPQNYPTHPQAEVLVFAPIPVRYITEIHFFDKGTLDSWCSSYARHVGIDPQIFAVNQQHFNARGDYGVWRPKNFNKDGIPVSYAFDNNIDVHLPATADEDELEFEDIPF